jgi:hypothetical protein
MSAESLRTISDNPVYYAKRHAASVAGASCLVRSGLMTNSYTVTSAKFTQ